MKYRNLEEVTAEIKKVKNCIDELSSDNQRKQIDRGDIKFCSLSKGDITPKCKYINSSIFTIDEKGYFRNICKYNKQ